MRRIGSTLLPVGIVCLLATAAPLRADTAQPLSSTTAQSSAATQSNAATLDALYRETVDAHPALHAARERWRAALSAVAVARGWPDPRLGYTRYLASVETALGPQRQALSLSQTIPWFGTLGARGDAATARARAAYDRLHSARLDLYRRVAEAWYDYAYLSRAAEITRENLDLLRQAEGVQDTRYRVNEVPYAALLRLQTAVGRLEDRLRSLEDRRIPLGARLNESLGRPPDENLPWPVELRPGAEAAPDDATVLARIELGHPDLAALADEVEAGEYDLDAARKSGYPDLHLTVGTILTDPSDLTGFPDAGRDAWTASIGLDLPLWRGKVHGAIDKAAAETRAREHALTDARRRLRVHTEQILFDRRDARRSERLHAENLVPRARQALEAILADYTAGEASYLDFIDAQRELLDLELTLARARTDHYRADAALLALIDAVPDAPDREESR